MGCLLWKLGQKKQKKLWHCIPFRGGGLIRITDTKKIIKIKHKDNRCESVFLFNKIHFSKLLIFPDVVLCSKTGKLLGLFFSFFVEETLGPRCLRKGGLSFFQTMGDQPCWRFRRRHKSGGWGTRASHMRARTEGAKGPAKRGECVDTTRNAGHSWTLSGFSGRCVTAHIKNYSQKKLKKAAKEKS